jgi:uncharacterized membrane protein YhhN
MKSRTLLLNLTYAFIALLVLIGSLNGNIWLNYPVKPFIMIWIAVYFLLMTNPSPYRWLVLLAFFFSWTGDMILMLGGIKDMLFFAGVGSFFLSQVLYIQAFRKFNLPGSKGFIEKKPLWLLPFIIYLAGMYLILSPGLTPVMKPVVLLYGISLTGMSAAAFNRLGLMPPAGFMLLFAGSVLFVISDSLLAFNKFSAPIANSGFLVMSTYMLAQYLIVQGLVFKIRPEGEKEHPDQKK